MSETAGQTGKQAWVQRVLGFASAGAAGGGAKAALDQWTRSRAEVIAQLRELEAAIRSMADPLADEAIILVKAISANLTAVPDSKQSVVELRRYLQNDIIDDAELENGFGITVRIRAPLVPALDALDQALAA